MVAQTCLSVKLYAKYPACFYYYYLSCYVIAVRSLIAQSYVIPIQFHFLSKEFQHSSLIMVRVFNLWNTCGNGKKQFICS